MFGIMHLLCRRPAILFLTFYRVFSLASIDSVNELSSIRQQIVRIKEAEGVSEVRTTSCIVSYPFGLVHLTTLIHLLERNPSRSRW